MCPPRASERSSQQQRCNYSTHLAFSFIIGRNCTALCTVIFFLGEKSWRFRKRPDCDADRVPRTREKIGFRSGKKGSCEEASNDSRDKRGKRRAKGSLSSFWQYWILARIKGHLMNTKKGRMPIARKRRANLAAGASADIGRGKTGQGKDVNCTLSYPKKHRIGFLKRNTWYPFSAEPPIRIGLSHLKLKDEF